MLNFVNDTESEVRLDYGKLLIIATHAEDDAELLGAKIIHL